MKRVNLIPPEFATGKKAWVETGLWRQAVIGAIVLALAAGIHFTYGFVALMGLKHQIASIERNAGAEKKRAESIRQSKETLNTQLKTLERKMKTLEKKQVVLGGLGTHSFKWSEALQDFKGLIPQKAWIDELMMTRPRGEPSRVIGGGFSNQDVSQFLEHLNGSKYFSNAAFVRTEAGKLNASNIVRFELTFDTVQKN